MSKKKKPLDSEETVEKSEETKPDEDVTKEEQGEEASPKEQKITAEDQINELNDKLKRCMAEFDNFRKRTEKEKAGRFEMGQRSVVERLLPIVDIFEKGLGSLDDEKEDDAFIQGMRQTHKQLAQTLSELGVEPIEAVGKTFNPDFHNAVMHIEDEAEPENTIVEEFQKGYMMNGTVVRYSMVKVAN